MAPRQRGHATTEPTDRPSVSAYNVAICRALAAHDSADALRGADTLAEIFLTDEARRSLYIPALVPRMRASLKEASPGG